MENQNNEPYNIAEVSLIYKNKCPASQRPKITSVDECFGILRSAWDQNRIELLEEFKILLVDRGMRCLGVSHIATGGYSGCLVDPKIIFATALKSKASGIVLAHNHPSGNPNPSKADIAVTDKLVYAGALLEIFVHDHVILTSESCLSFAEQGMMPELKFSS